MKKIGLLVYMLLFTAGLLFSQNVGTGTNTPNASAQLDITSTTKGILIPRMTLVQRQAIASSYSQTAAGYLYPKYSGAQAKI